MRDNGSFNSAGITNRVYSSQWSTNDTEVRVYFNSLTSRGHEFSLNHANRRYAHLLMDLIR